MGAWGARHTMGGTSERVALRRLCIGNTGGLLDTGRIPLGRITAPCGPASILPEISLSPDG